MSTAQETHWRRLQAFAFLEFFKTMASQHPPLLPDGWDSKQLTPDLGIIAMAAPVEK